MGLKHIFKSNTIFRCQKLAATLLQHRGCCVGSESECYSKMLLSEKCQTSRTKNDILFASIENYYPLTQIAIAINAGPRHENGKNLGLSHMMRNCAVLSRKDRTAFSLVRNFEYNGSKLHAVSTREYIVFNLHCLRDNFDESFRDMAHAITQQVFYPWEVGDLLPSIRADLEYHRMNKESVLIESLHKVCFKNGLSHSLFCEPCMIGKHTPQMLMDFASSMFVPSRTAVLGIGVTQQELQEAIETHLNFPTGKEHDCEERKCSPYIPGQVRIEDDTPMVHSIVVGTGAAILNPKDALGLSVFQCILGTGPHVQTGDCRFTKLGEAAAEATDKPFHVSTLNINYSDTGIFGVYVVGDPYHMGDLLKNVVGKMIKLSKSVSEEDVQIGKQKLKAKMAQDRECTLQCMTSMAIELSEAGKIMTFEDLEKVIDEVEVQDVASAVGKMVRKYPAMAALGPLHSTPYVDELVGGNQNIKMTKE